LRLLPTGTNSDNLWCFELQSREPGARIPDGYKLRLLSEDLQPFPGNEAIASEQLERLYIEVALAPGEGVVWETEPLPMGYECEVLRF